MVWVSRGDMSALCMFCSDGIYAPAAYCMNGGNLMGSTLTSGLGLPKKSHEFFPSLPCAPRSSWQSEQLPQLLRGGREGEGGR